MIFGGGASQNRDPASLAQEGWFLRGSATEFNQTKSFLKPSEDYSFEKNQIWRSGEPKWASGQNLDQNHWFPYTNTTADCSIFILPLTGDQHFQNSELELGASKICLE